MENILRALYYGNYIPYENIAPKNHIEYMAINAKISEEKSYYKIILSGDNYNRLEKLETLYTESSEIAIETAYMVGFRLAVKIMAEVYAENEKLPDFNEVFGFEK